MMPRNKSDGGGRRHFNPQGMQQFNFYWCTCNLAPPAIFCWFSAFPLPIWFSFFWGLWPGDFEYGIWAWVMLDWTIGDSPFYGASRVLRTPSLEKILHLSNPSSTMDKRVVKFSRERVYLPETPVSLKAESLIVQQLPASVLQYKACLRHSLLSRLQS